MKTTFRHSDTLRLTIDTVSLAFIATLVLLAVVFPDSISNSATRIRDLVAAGVLYGMAAIIVRRIPVKMVSQIVHSSAVLALFSFLFQAVGDYQHILVEGWMDETLLSMERSLLGTEVVLSFRRLTNPIVTEWMMFAYVLYVPLLKITMLACYRSGNPSALYDYLLNLSLAYVVCYVGFVLFPVASPLYHAPQLFTTGFDGGLFTWMGEWIRTNQHYAGGSLPSPHCAAGTVMMVMFYRYNRRWFFILLPTFLTIYVATVYGRFHYAWDGIAGILTAAAVIRWSPVLAVAVESLKQKLSEISKQKIPVHFNPASKPDYTPGGAGSL